jgi:hypothetical protein
MKFRLLAKEDPIPPAEFLGVARRMRFTHLWVVTR